MKQDLSAFTIIAYKIDKITILQINHGKTLFLCAPKVFFFMKIFVKIIKKLVGYGFIKMAQCLLWYHRAILSGGWIYDWNMLFCLWKLFIHSYMVVNSRALAEITSTGSAILVALRSRWCAPLGIVMAIMPWSGLLASTPPPCHGSSKPLLEFIEKVELSLE